MHPTSLALVLAVLAAMLVVSSSASAATDRCRPRVGERALARSVDAVVLWLRDAFTGRVGPYRDDVDVRSEEPSSPDLDIWRLGR